MVVIKWLLKWAPFKIDALGLVSLLGANDVDRAIGQISRSQWTDYLPFVAGFVVASDSFRMPVPGFALYNISDGIYAIDIAGWFSRWLMSQGLTYNSSTLIISVPQRYHIRRDCIIRPVWYGIAVAAVLVILPLLMADWWGLANSLALGTSVLIRCALLDMNRDAIDVSAENGISQSRTVVKTFWTLPNGSSVTIYVPRGVLTECLLNTPRVAKPRRYFGLRIGAWVAFSIHVVSLGMTALPNQMLAVSVLVASTVCVIVGVGTDKEMIGSRIVLHRTDHQGRNNSMAAVFARLKLCAAEEESMVAWKLMPHRRNEIWWRKYADCIVQNNERAFDTWKDKEKWVFFEDLVLSERATGNEGVQQSAPLT